MSQQEEDTPEQHCDPLPQTDPKSLNFQMRSSAKETLSDDGDPEESVNTTDSHRAETSRGDKTSEEEEVLNFENDKVSGWCFITQEEKSKEGDVLSKNNNAPQPPQPPQAPTNQDSEGPAPRTNPQNPRDTPPLPPKGPLKRTTSTGLGPPAVSAVAAAVSAATSKVNNLSNAGNPNNNPQLQLKTAPETNNRPIVLKDAPQVQVAQPVAGCAPPNNGPVSSGVTTSNNTTALGSPDGDQPQQVCDLFPSNIQFDVTRERYLFAQIEEFCYAEEQVEFENARTVFEHTVPLWTRAKDSSTMSSRKIESRTSATTPPAQGINGTSYYPTLVGAKECTTASTRRRQAKRISGRRPTRRRAAATTAAGSCGKKSGKSKEELEEQKLRSMIHRAVHILQQRNGPVLQALYVLEHVSFGFQTDFTKMQEMADFLRNHEILSVLASVLNRVLRQALLFPQQEAVEEALRRVSAGSAPTSTKKIGGPAGGSDAMTPTPRAPLHPLAAMGGGGVPRFGAAPRSRSDMSSDGGQQAAYSTTAAKNNSLSSNPETSARLASATLETVSTF